MKGFRVEKTLVSHSRGRDHRQRVQIGDAVDTTTQFTGLVLAGGAGRRAGGRDKGLLNYSGRPLVTYAIDQLAQQVDRLLISCNRNRDEYARYGELAPADVRPGFAGPLAGLEAVAGTVKRGYLLVVPCDNPNLPLNLGERLLQPLRESGREREVCWAHDGERDQYLYCAMSTACLPTLTEFLDEGGRAVRHWLAQREGVAVDFSDQAQCFTNLNTLANKPH